MLKLYRTLAIALTLCILARPALAGDKPNIVLILSDDQTFTDYGFMGHDVIQTPHLDRLSKDSALFRRGYVPTALCRPALMTLATGLYSYQNMITGNDPAKNDVNAGYAKATGKTAKEILISQIDKIATLPRLLGEAGYVSHQSGKWWEGSYQRGGFTHGMTRGYPKKGGRHGDDGLLIGRRPAGEPRDSEGTDIAGSMKPVFDFIDQAVEDDKPFFVWYAPFLPHTPHNPPKRLLDKYLAQGRPLPIAKYYAMVQWLDETVGQMIKKLDDDGLSKNTLVIYVTDNGWVQRPDSGGYAKRSKRSPYEGGTRTPIMFKWPGTIKPADRPELCSSIDIFPTILSAAGAQVPADRPGLNLLPYLKTNKKIKRDTVFGESFAHDIADIKNPEKSLLYRWVIKGDLKLLLTYDGIQGRMVYRPEAGAPPELYNLKTDPFEKNNLAAKHPDKVKAMTQLLDGWWKPKTAKHSGNAKP